MDEKENRRYMRIWYSKCIMVLLFPPYTTTVLFKKVIQVVFESFYFRNSKIYNIKYMLGLIRVVNLGFRIASRFSLTFSLI